MDNSQEESNNAPLGNNLFEHMCKPEKGWTAPPIGNRYNPIRNRINKEDVSVYDVDQLCGMLRIATTMVGGRNTVAGWRNDPVTGKPIVRDDALLCSLALTELGEAFEGVRRNRMDDKLPHRKQVEVELADLVYRIFDWCDERGYDLGGAFAEKMVFNMHRADHKASERVKDGGKLV